MLGATNFEIYAVSEVTGLYNFTYINGFTTVLSVFLKTNLSSKFTVSLQENGILSTPIFIKGEIAAGEYFAGSR